MEEADGRGAAGEAGRRRGRLGCGAAGPRRGRRQPKVEDSPDRWVPPVGEREREERKRWAGGFNWAWRNWWAAGREDGPRDRFVFFPFFFFKSFSNYFKTFLNQIFYIFFTTLFITIFKGLSQTFLNNFSNVF
jgi:hypothetical protein